MTTFRDRRRKNRWSYDFKLGGKRYQGTCDREDGTPCQRKAEANEAESRERARARAEQGMAKSGLRPGGYLLAQAIQRHISTAETEGASASHLASLKRIAGEMLRHFGLDRTIRSIAQPDVDAYRSFVVAQKRRIWIGGPRKIRDEDLDDKRLWKTIDRPRSPSEVNHCLDLLRCAFAAAHALQDPITGERALPFPPEVRPVADPKRDPRPMPEAELADRLDRAPPWTKDAAMLARLFGCRRGEALDLQLHHLDHEEECLRLRANETKSGKDQALYGGDAGWQLVLRLAVQAKARGMTHLVTWPGPRWAVRVARKGRIPSDDEPTAEWQPLQSLRRSWKRSATLAEVAAPHRFHDARAAYITGVAKLGSATITRRLARHASMATTELYIAVADRDLARAANRAAKRRGRLKVVK